MFVRELKSEKQELLPTVGKFLGEIETPAVVISSFLGNPLFTTPDAINEEKEPQLCQLDVADVVFKDFQNIELSKLYKPFDNVSHIMSGRVSGKKYDSNCEASGLSIDTHNGRKQLTVQKYAERVMIDKPKVVIALADEINQTLGKKRLTKAIERTATWFQNFVSSSTALGWDVARDSRSNGYPFLFGVAQYDQSYTVQLPLFIKNMLSHGAQGIVIGNAHLGESDAQRAAAIKAIKELLPTEVPTMIQGADSLHNILLALSLGIDLISTDYPHALSAKGHALALSPTLLSCIDDDAAPAQTNPDKRSISGHEGDTQKSNKRQRVETIFSDGSDQHAVEEVASERVSLRQGQSSHGGTPPTFRCELNLWDVKYCKDTRPLVEGCACHACRYHTRAYIHHLHICKEMLAEVLMHHHNKHQLLQLFRAARDHLRSGSFEDWLQRVQSCM